METVTAQGACLQNCESGKQFDNGNEHIPNQRHVIQAKRQTGTQAAGLESSEWTIDYRLVGQVESRSGKIEALLYGE